MNQLSDIKYSAQVVAFRDSSVELICYKVLDCGLSLSTVSVNQLSPSMHCTKVSTNLPCGFGTRYTIQATSLTLASSM